MVVKNYVRLDVLNTNLFNIYINIFNNVIGQFSVVQASSVITLHAGRSTWNCSDLDIIVFRRTPLQVISRAPAPRLGYYKLSRFTVLVNFLSTHRIDKIK